MTWHLLVYMWTKRRSVLNKHCSWVIICICRINRSFWKHLPSPPKKNHSKLNLNLCNRCSRSIRPRLRGTQGKGWPAHSQGRHKLRLSSSKNMPCFGQVDMGAHGAMFLLDNFAAAGFACFFIQREKLKTLKVINMKYAQPQQNYLAEREATRMSTIMIQISNICKIF